MPRSQCGKVESNSLGVPQRRRSMFSSSSLPYGVASLQNVGQVSHEVVLSCSGGTALGQTVNLLVDGTHGFLGGLGLVLLALLHQGADLLGLGITRGLELLDLGDDGTTLIVELKELLAIPRRLAISHGGIDGIGVLANKLDIKH